MALAAVPAIVVHGGAGKIDDERVPAALTGCRAAAARGLAVLARGGSALDAVQEAVRALEDDPQFNAGIGAALARDGTVELDASIMDGATLGFGAVGAVPELRRPVDLARAVLDDGEHCLLVGAHAWTFARERGFEPAAPGELITARARARLQAAQARALRGGAGEEAGTVGACAIDAAGHVAAATSTGGTTYKRPGRVGDTPLPGCGTYADDRAGAASATGFGERIMRVTLARLAADLMRGGKSAAEAAALAIAELALRVGGDAGIICVDPAGRIGAARSSKTMPHAWASVASPEPEAAL